MRVQLGRDEARALADALRGFVDRLQLVRVDVDDADRELLRERIPIAR